MLKRWKPEKNLVPVSSIVSIAFALIVSYFRAFALIAFFNV